MIERQEYPILEFDESNDAIITPYDQAIRTNCKYTNKLIITFSRK